MEPQLSLRYTFEPRMLALAGLCLLICIFNIIHLHRQKQSASRTVLLSKHTRWGLLCLVCSIICTVSTLTSACMDEFDDWTKILVGCLWVLVSLLRICYLSAPIGSSIFLKNSTFLSLTVFLTTNLPLQLYPLIWLPAQLNHSFSTLDVIQLVAAFADSIIIPLLTPRSSRPLGDYPHPAETCPPLSRWWLYTWVSPLVSRGYRRNGTISSDDLLPIKEDRSVQVWHEAYLSYRHESLPFRMVLWRLFRLRIVVIAFFAGMCGVFELLGAIGLHQLLLYLQKSNKETLQPWFSVVLFATCPIFRGIFMQTFEYFATHTIGDWKALIMTAVYQKLMMLEADTNIDCGQLQNNISADIDRLGTLRYTAMTAFMVPVEFIMASILLYKVMGWYYIPSLAFLLLTRIPLSTFIISAQTKAQSGIVQATDKRISRTSESIRALTIIKMLGNAQSFMRKILDERRQELDAIWLKMQVIALSESLSSACTFLALILCLFLLTVVGKRPPEPEVVFTLVAVFNILRSMLTLSVLGAGQYAQAMVSLQRLGDFMDQEDSEMAVACSKCKEQRKNGTTQSEQSYNTRPFENLSAEQAHTGLELVKNGLNVVTGDTGSGKTLLLQSLLLGRCHAQDDIGLHKAQYEAMGYASQDPWLYRGSVKENILFGAPFNPGRYASVIRDCALEQDIATFKDGDLKDVGDCGRSLSGGQRQRIALARAIYMNARVVILDDILSGLDTKTFEWVVEKCILGPQLQNRSLIIVTNNSRLHEAADLIIYMRDGSVAKTERKYPKKTEPQLLDISTRSLSPSLASETLFAGETTTVNDNDDICESSCEISNETNELRGIGGIRYGFKYLQSFGTRPFITLVAVFTIGAQAMEIGLPAWISIWSTASTNNKGRDTEGFFICVFAGLGSAQILILAISLLLLYSGAWRASRDKHVEMLATVFGATYAWVSHTPTGQVINRFSSDIASLDDTLFKAFRPVLETYLSIGLRIVTVSSLIPLFLLPSVLLCGLAIYVGRRYQFAATAVKHLYAASLTPLHHNIAETTSGLMTIHAFRAEKMLQARFNAAVEHHVRAWRTVSDLQRWLAVRMDIFVALISFSAATLALLQKHSSAPAVGLSLTLTTGLCTALLYLVYLSSLLEVEMANYCRIENYIQNVPQEPCSCATDDVIVEDWPTQGLVDVQNLTTSYSLHENEVLRDVTFRAEPGHKIAIVGRTGSGKSSLALSLLRLTIRLSGSVYIDGINIEFLEVDKLRRHISLIPQDPTLFDGTIRSNLDINGGIGDEYLQEVLDDVAGTKKWKLDDAVEANGKNFSQGERQLISLARAMVSKPKFLIVDEGTASLDQESEERIMAVIRARFSGCTVITITHRLHNILDFDQVLVMDKGRVVEKGHPRQLLGGDEGSFRALYMKQCRTKLSLTTIHVRTIGNLFFLFLGNQGGSKKHRKFETILRAKVRMYGVVNKAPTQDSLV